MTSRPNILLIQCDQLRYDCIAHNGHRLAHTPNLDRLAREGIRFERAYTPIPTCCPARQCLLSGQWAEVHGGLWNYDITLMPPDFNVPTWPPLLAAAGYHLGYVGKWHVHPTRTPLDFGFHDYVSEGDYGAWRASQGIPPNELRLPEDPWGGEDHATLESAGTHWMAQQAIDLLRRYEAGGRPWHLRLDHPEPHLPCFPVREWLEHYPIGQIEPWGNFPDPLVNKPYIQHQLKLNWHLEELGWSSWAQYVQRYLAMVSQVDDAVGRVLDDLDELGCAERTLVIFTTDHGDACGSHGLLDKHYVMYEEITHVPLLARWPGVAPAGQSCGLFVSAALDLAETIVDLCGLDFATQGRSLLPLLQGQQPGDWRRYACSTYNGQQYGLFCQRMLRDERWKYVWNPTDLDELYDLEQDPWELRNLIGEPGVAADLARLRVALAQELHAHGDRLVGCWLDEQLLQGRKYVPKV